MYRCCALIIKSPTLLQFLVQLAFRRIFQYKIDTCFVVEIAIHAQDMRMPEIRTFTTIHTQLSTHKF